MLNLSFLFKDKSKIYFAYIGMSMLYLKKKDFEKSADFWLLADALFLGIEGPYAKSQHYLVQAQIEVNEKKATLASQAVLKAEQIILTLD